nr:hypothetical protein [Amylibacter sp.]
MVFIFFPPLGLGTESTHNKQALFRLILSLGENRPVRFLSGPNGSRNASAVDPLRAALRIGFPTQLGNFFVNGTLTLHQRTA